MKYRMQRMYNHMVGRTASVISPFYSLLPAAPQCCRPLKFQTMNAIRSSKFEILEIYIIRLQKYIDYKN